MAKPKRRRICHLRLGGQQKVYFAFKTRWLMTLSAARWVEGTDRADGAKPFYPMISAWVVLTISRRKLGICIEWWKFVYLPTKCLLSSGIAAQSVLDAHKKSMIGGMVTSRRRPVGLSISRSIWRFANQMAIWLWKIHCSARRAILLELVRFKTNH